MEKKIRLHVERARGLLNQRNVSFGNQKRALMHVERASQLKFGKPQCKYGINCTRKDPEHFEKYDHPKDHLLAEFYRPFKPQCQYGSRCYRTNPEHFDKYSHPPLDRNASDLGSSSQTGILFTVVTYNASWEAMSGSEKGTAGVLGQKCKKTLDEKTKLNDCLRRLVHVCSNHPHDIICLQEVESDVDKLIAHEINEKGEDHACIRHDDFNRGFGAKVSIIHSKRLIRVDTFSSYIMTQDRQRNPTRGPVVGALFFSIDGNFSLAVLNVHAPHHIDPMSLQDQMMSVLMKLCQITEISKIEHVILAGDFNQEMKDFKAKKTDKWEELKFHVMNPHFKTGWDSEGGGTRNIDKGQVKGLKYKYVVDNILGANVDLKYVESWCCLDLRYLPKSSSIRDNIALPMLTSDHAPVVAQVSITPANL